MASSEGLLCSQGNSTLWPSHHGDRWVCWGQGHPASLPSCCGRVVWSAHSLANTWNSPFFKNNFAVELGARRSFLGV